MPEPREDKERVAGGLASGVDGAREHAGGFLGLLGFLDGFPQGSP